MKKLIFLSLVLSFILFLLFCPFFIQLVSYLHSIVLIVVVFCHFIFILFILLLIYKKTIYIRHSLFLWIYILYTIALLVLLFFRPNNQTYESINLIPFSTIHYYLTGNVEWIVSFYNLAANIGLFIPYGILLLTKNYSVLKLLLIPILFISFIEILQFITHRGSLDIDDLILNVFGILIGYLLYPSFKRVFQLY
ncbi:VanZ family protein [Cytobacillus massiliigabonensis]|uniref:VanZ family protein n=1 Tax=Cytobacillus massiliigabonensis TaxID=1871011 RepID=UPI000C835E2B|nr:VanZ family protein [Cytobacillus massiliigabonensis]